MSCGCIYTDCDGDGAVLSQAIRTAAKKHDCTECQRTIEKGEKYEVYNGVFDGDFFTSKTCPDCLSARNEFFCGGYCLESIWDDIRTHIFELEGEISSECIARLTPRSREKLIEIIDDCFQWIDG